jgi:sporulation protein YlmC with PRC-barrel domain
LQRYDVRRPSTLLDARNHAMKTLLITTATALVLSNAGFGAAQAQAFMEYNYDEAQELSTSDLIGARIYATETQVADTIQPGEEANWDDIGEINDIIVNRDGQIEAVILGVGGFLGIGERNVAIRMSDIRFVSDGTGASDYFLVVNANRAAVEGAPAFQRTRNAMGDAAATTGAVVGTAATTMGDAAGNAAAPLTADNQTNTNLVGTDPVASTDTAALSTNTQTVPITPSTVQGDLNNTADTSDVEVPIIKSETSLKSELATNDVEANLQAATDNQTVPADTGAMAPTVGGTTDMAMGRPMMQREGYTEVAMDQLTVEDIDGATVYGANDDNIGEVGELVMAADGKTIDQAVINVGGFLGLGVKHVAIPFSELQILRNGENDTRIYMNATEDSLKALPDFEM